MWVCRGVGVGLFMVIFVVGRGKFLLLQWVGGLVLWVCRGGCVLVGSVVVCFVSVLFGGYCYWY